LGHRSDDKNKVIIARFSNKADHIGQDSPGPIYDAGVETTKFTKRNFSIGCNKFSKDSRWKSTIQPGEHDY